MSSPRLRGATEADAAAIPELFTRSFGSSRPVDAEEIRVWLRNEAIAPADVRVLDVGGRVVGYGDVWVESEVALDAAAPRMVGRLLRVGGETGARSRCRTREGYFPHGHELESVVAARGYRYWRSSYTMEIDLDGKLTAPELPEGIQLHSYTAADADTLRVVMNEAFAGDAFWHEVTPSNFREFFLRARGFDPSLWFLAWDRGQLAGFALAYSRRGSDETSGWIGSLGVRAPWRRRGLGSALLRHAFIVLRGRGLARAGLGVDAENPTGAVALYENADMRQVTRNDNWMRDA